MSGYDTTAPLNLDISEKIRADLEVETENVRRLRRSMKSISAQYYKAVDRRKELNDQLLWVGYTE